MQRARIARRRDLLAAGFTDENIREALGVHQIFRVRHGWYALPSLSEQLIAVIRVGGRLTGLAALCTLDVYLPKPSTIDVAVSRGAAGLRDPRDRRAALTAGSAIRVNWVDPPRGDRAASEWIATEEEALLCVLRKESREVAVSCCDALLRYRGWNRRRLKRVFALAPARVSAWLADVDDAGAWGETVARIRVRDAGIPFEPQVFVRGVGTLDGRISPRCFIEIDGLQHSQDWAGAAPSSFENDHDRDIQLLLLEGAHTIRITYRQIENNWPLYLAAIRRAYGEDVAE